MTEEQKRTVPEKNTQKKESNICVSLDSRNIPLTTIEFIVECGNDENICEETISIISDVYA
jgi:hypothetical protein